MEENKFTDASVPRSFHINNLVKLEHSIKLAELAKIFIIQNNINNTESNFLETTKMVDENGKGISHSTLYKNKKVHEIFISINPSKIAKTNRKKRQSRKLGKTKLCNLYNGISRKNIINMIEVSKDEINNLKMRISVLNEENESLRRQNTNQLVLLTKLQNETK